MIAVSALMLVACSEGGKDYVVNGGVTSSSGQNCHTFDYSANPDALTMNGVEQGDSSQVSLKLKFTIKSGIHENASIGDLWDVRVSGRDDNKDVEFKLKADEKSMEAIKNLKDGETAEMTFTGMVPTADLEQLNGQNTWISVSMP